ncbi:hypothetical protein BOX15_Mlig032040g2, partial [Macrostomum lignano]
RDKGMSSDSVRVVFSPQRQRQQEQAAAAATAGGDAAVVTEESMLASVNGVGGGGGEAETSTAGQEQPAPAPNQRSSQRSSTGSRSSTFPTVPIEMIRQLAIEQHAIIQPVAPLPLRNKITQCQPSPVSRRLQAAPTLSDAGVQAAVNPDAALYGDGSKGLLPCPLPLYFPAPAPLPPDPVPVPVFVPIPVPIPVFLLLESPDPEQPPHLALQTPASAASQTASMASAAAAVTDVASFVEIQRRLADDAASLVALARRPVRQQQQQLSLKFSYGLTAWKNWSRSVGGEGTAGPPADPADLTPASALADALARFVREVRKPSGEEYAADSVYYLCLGLQGHLAIERAREENIFCDPAFAEFAAALDSVLDRYSARVTEDGTLVCRIEEQHLWECRQLGCHSPDSLIFSLFYILTRYVGLHTVQEHAELTLGQFALASPASGGAGAVLRFTPRSGYAVGITYELGELTDPTRCPVRLFQVYLAKRPLLTGRDEPFYLPTDRRAGPEDAVWYSGGSEDPGSQLVGLPAAELQRWLNRVRCVKEIQEALMQAQIQWPGAALDPSLAAAAAE